MIFLDIIESDFGSILIGIGPLNDARVYYQHGWCQSESDRYGVSHAPYIHALFGLVQQMSTVDVLMIGCGGGTLATMLSRSGHRVTVVDIDPEAIAVARRYFAMDGTVSCFVGDGMEWLSTSRRLFDCIVVDAFEGCKIPGHLCSRGFFAVVERHFAPQGVMLMNVLEESDHFPLADDIAANLLGAGLDVRLLEQDSTSDRNVIVLAGAVQGFEKPSLLMPPSGAGERLAGELERMRFRAPRRVGTPSLAYMSSAPDAALRPR
jgi:spermidine synthase